MAQERMLRVEVHVLALIARESKRDENGGGGVSKGDALDMRPGREQVWRWKRPV